MRAVTIVTTATALLACAGTIALAAAHRSATRELAELKTAQPVLAACPIPPADSPQSLIIWRSRAADGSEEIRCVHGRIRAADVRHGVARPGSGS